MVPLPSALHTDFNYLRALSPPPDAKMELVFNPFDNLLCILLGISFTVWFTLLLVFIIVPAIFGVSFGIRRLYMKTLLKIFEVRTSVEVLSHPGPYSSKG